MKKFTFTHGKIYKQTAKRFACIMKLSFFFLLICLHVAAKSVEQKVTLNVQNEKFGKVLKAIELQTSCRFIYSNKIVPVDKPVSISVKDKDLYEVLDILLASFNLDYHKEDGKIIVIFQEKNTDQQVNISAADAPSQTVSGMVTDESGNPLERVSVMIKGSSKGTVTNSSGYFKIEITNDNAALVFSYAGYVNKEIAVGLQTVINVTLVLEQKALDQVVILAYGNTTKRTSTGAAQTINAKELMDLPVAQIGQKLQGKLAGVQIYQGTGKPGRGMKITVRGQASISAGTDPLYVVDGFPLAGDVNFLNPDEIDNITVLKDASSAALYGSRAANGVVLITTKRGKAGRTDINVSSSYGIQKVPQKGRPDLMNAQEFAQYRKEAFEDLGVPVPAMFQNPTQYGKGTDWYDALLRTAPMENHSISITSGGERFRTAAVAGFFDQQGVVLNSEFKRFSLRINSEFKVSEKINLGFNLAPQYVIDKNPPTDGTFYGKWFDPTGSAGLLFNAWKSWPVYSYRNPDGSYAENADVTGVSGFPTPNWARSMHELKTQTRTSSLLSNAYINYEPIRGLTLKSSINLDVAEANFERFKPTNISLEYYAPAPTPSDLLRNNRHHVSWLNENLVTYKRTIGRDHNFELLGGYTTQKFRSDFSQIALTNLPDDRILNINTGLENIDKGRTFSDVQEWSLISYLSRLQYNFKGKYLLSASIRRDGSSRFGKNNRWGNFPAVSAGWVVSDENFLNKKKSISFLKIRASYGLTGNNNIGNYTQYALVGTSTNAVFGNTVVPGASVTNLGNSDLGWEKSTQLDIGIDLGLLNDRLNFTYDYYTRKTDDFLFNVNLPQESGFSSVVSNVGKMKFWGHEFAISSKNLVRNFKWNTDFNISFARNKVLSLSNGVDELIPDYLGGYIIKVGQPLNQFYGYIWDGVYKDQADLDKSPKSDKSSVGTIKLRDFDGDGKVSLTDNSDKTIIGNPYPKYVFGITNSFNYLNFDLGVVITGAVGGSIMRRTDQGLTNLDGVFNVLREVKDRWRSPQNPGNGKYGSTNGGPSITSVERDLPSSRFVHKGDYLTVKNITLGYTFPFKNSQHYFKSLRVYTSIQQAFVFTKYTGGNPEVSVDANDSGNSRLRSNPAPGMDWGAYPVPRTISFGINVGL